MQSIAEWLEALGLGEYAQRFAENGIDLSALGHLSDQDLKDLGVLLGHRRKLQAAIAGLPGAAPAPRKTAAAPITRAKDAAERRQLTVMFCDLVGSTALSARLDPEDLRAIISTYHRCCTELVERNGGFVAKYMGDGALIYFGYPLAHEDDAERAVAAGLAVVEAVPKLDFGSGTTLRVRIGIATGLVVVGDLLGEGATEEQAVIGETPNLAARLQALAEPDTVVIDAGTRRLLRGLCEYRDLGMVSVKGFGDPVPAWQVVGVSATDSRFEALHSGPLPLVGRDEEIELLLRRWQQIKSGKGRAVFITGEPGIGKSRITTALQERLRGEAHTRLRYFCSPHHQDSALHPLIRRLERAAGFTRDEVAEEKLTKLEALLAQSSAQPEEIGYIAELLSIPKGRRYPLPELNPQKRKEKTLTALLAQMERLAAQQPVLVVYEDVQWIDPTTLELLTLTLEQIQHVPVLLIVTARPEFKQPWPAYAHVTNLTLGRIGREEVASLICQVTGGKSLPKEVTDRIIDRTDGVPLFIEELTKTVIESGVLTDAGDRYTLAGPLPPLAIPTSLNASLLARLDRLAPVREVAQIGAALGRQFTHKLIGAVAPMPPPQLDDALSQLVRSELILRRGTPPDAEYSFKHTLVQDAAYSTLLRSRRQLLHGQIVESLEGQFPETMETQPEVLARHCEAAGLVEKAIDYLRKAGRQAIARGAMTEALSQLRKGLDLLPAMPDGIACQERELELQIALGNALIATNGYGAPEPGEAFARARQLCEQLSRPPKLGVLAGQFTFRLIRGELDQADLHAEEIRQLGEALDDVRCKIIGSNCSGCSGFYLGKLIHARACLENSISKWDPKFRGIAVTQEDPYATGLIHLSRTLLCLGHIEKARLQRDKGLIEARRLSPYNLAVALYQAWLGDWAMEGVKSRPTMLRSAEQALAVFSEEGLPMWISLASVMRGWCLGVIGQASEGVPLMLRGLSDYRATGGKIHIPFALTVLAEVQGKSAQPEEGLNRLAEAAKLVETTQERWAEAEIHRLRGVLLLSVRECAAAEESYHHAIAVARRQSAKFWELRAATSLACLWRDQGKRIEARALLASIYGWFTEGFDAPVLQDAKALLDELA